MPLHWNSLKQVLLRFLLFSIDFVYFCFDEKKFTLYLFFFCIS